MAAYAGSLNPVNNLTEMLGVITIAEKHIVKNSRLFFRSRLAHLAVLLNGQRYACTKEPTNTFGSLRAPHSKHVRKRLGELLVT